MALEQLWVEALGGSSGDGVLGIPALLPMRDIGHLAPHRRYKPLYLNGDYWGNYLLRERWNASMAVSYLGGDQDDYETIDADNQASDFGDGNPSQRGGSG